MSVRHALAIALLLGACGRSSSRAKPKDAAPAAETTDASLPDAPVGARRHADPAVRAQLDNLAPVSKPPPPISRKHRRGDCSTTYAPRPDRDPNPMCRVDGGTFMFGGGTYMVIDHGTEQVHVDAVQTTVRSFYIDQLEVTAAQAARFLNAHGNSCDGLDAKQNPGEVTPCVVVDARMSPLVSSDGLFAAKKGMDQNPETLFSWEGAMRYCAWVGKRVPSSAEWEYAARHDPIANHDAIFPWGDAWLPKAAACNVAPCERRPVLPGPDAKGPPDPTYLPVGVFDGTRGRPDGSSPWGLHDTSGGSAELVFACELPDATCTTGEACHCRVQSTSSSDASSIEHMRVDHRADDTAWGFGLTGVRCVSVFKS